MQVLGPVIGQISAKSLQDKGVLSQCHVNVCQLIDTVAHSDYQSELKYLTTERSKTSIHCQDDESSFADRQHTNTSRQD